MIPPGEQERGLGINGMRARSFGIAVLIALWCGTVVSGATAGAALRAPEPLPRPDATRLAAAETGLSLKSRGGPTGPSAWMLVSLDRGTVIDAQAPDMALAPASVAKLVTAVYAFENLGPEHRFPTRLLASGAVSGGVLAGDLILSGQGDPELDTDRLEPLVAAARRAGIVQIEGRFLVDGGATFETPTIDPTQPVEAAYNPGFSALNLNFNRVRLRWTGGQGQDRLSVTAEAERLAPEVELVTARADRVGSAVFRHAISDVGEAWEIERAALSNRGSRWLPVKRPSIYAGDAFRAVAKGHGLSLPQPERGAAGAGALLVAEVNSRPVGEILPDMLRFSTNLTAEALGVAASRASGAAPATLRESGAVMSDWAASFAALPPDADVPDLRNHSGLSADSRITPRQVVQFLFAAAQRPLRGAPAHDALPGPLAAMLNDVPIADATERDVPDGVLVLAKTGTMDYIRGLAGFLRGPKGRRYAFAILSNDLAQRDGASRGIDRAWMRRAVWFERALLRSWVRELGRSQAG